jgi:hypothetical protein
MDFAELVKLMIDSGMEIIEREKIIADNIK